MAFTEAQIAACKVYMKAEDEENSVIEGFMDAAAEYLGLEPSEDLSPMEKLAIHSLTLNYYDHRDAVGTEADMPRGLGPIINQIKIKQLATES